MKRILTMLLIVAANFTCFAQGTIQFANIFGTTAARTFLAPIYAGDPSNPMLQVHGNTSIGVPAGTAVYPGGLLNVPGFTMGLFKGETMVASAPIRTSATGALPAGTVAVQTATVPDALPGTTVVLQIRVWDSRNGADSWVKVLADPRVMWGASENFTSGRLGGIDPLDGSIITAPNTVGWTSFSINGYPTTVPEPSAIVVGAVGLCGLLFLRKRNAE